MKRARTKITKPVFLVLGFLAVGIGAIGTITPILPTTPFLLLGLYCFTRSSKHFYNWFVATKLYKIYLQDYVETRSMPVGKKLTILFAASILLILAAILTHLLWLRIFIGVLILCKYYFFIFKIKTRRNVNTANSIEKEKAASMRN